MNALSIFLLAVNACLAPSLIAAESTPVQPSHEDSSKPFGIGLSAGLIDLELATGVRFSKGIFTSTELELSAYKTGLAFREEIVSTESSSVPSNLVALDAKQYLSESFYLLGGFARNMPVDADDGLKTAPSTNRYHIAIGNKWDLSSNLFFDARWAGWYDGAGRKSPGGYHMTDLLNLTIGYYLN